MKSGFAAAQTQTISSGIWKSFKQQEEQDYFQLNIFSMRVCLFLCVSAKSLNASVMFVLLFKQHLGIFSPSVPHVLYF